MKLKLEEKDKLAKLLHHVSVFTYQVLAGGSDFF
jgi:hypothetical protein